MRKPHPGVQGRLTDFLMCFRTHVDTRLSLSDDILTVNVNGFM